MLKFLPSFAVQSSIFVDYYLDYDQRDVDVTVGSFSHVCNRHEKKEALSLTALDPEEFISCLVKPLWPRQTIVANKNQDLGSYSLEILVVNHEVWEANIRIHYQYQ